MTTFTSYGEVPTQRQGEIIRGLSCAEDNEQAIDDKLVRAVIQGLQGAGLGTKKQRK